MRRWPAVARYGLAIAAAHGAFRVLAEAGFLATDTRGRIKAGPRIGP